MKFTAAQTACTWSIPAGVSSVDVLVVGGGGGAGFGNNGGGGGAGGVLYSNTPLSVVPGDVVTLTVGNYGAGGYNDNSGSWNFGWVGETSSVTINSNTYRAPGGGGGGGNNRTTGSSGGSGGGGALSNSGGSSVRYSYSGFTDAGFAGGLYNSTGAGGGGAGGAGTNATGGTGITLWGLSFGGGGGGWSSGTGATAFGGGSAGGGYASGSGIGTSASNHGTPGTDGTGGGGGGGEHGGTGLVVFRYLIDIAAPTLSSAAVPSTGTSVVLTFSESISATTAPVSAFTVTANGTIDTVTSLSVSGVQITLNLQVLVTSALTVLVSYTDPTAGNDANAVQDLGLNDAATFTNQAVTNNSTSKTPGVITLVLSGDGRTAVYRAASTITMTSNSPGKARFTIAGKAIPGCQSVLTSPVSSSFQAVCTWKPGMRNQIIVTAVITPSSNLYSAPAPASIVALVSDRSGKR